MTDPRVTASSSSSISINDYTVDAGEAETAAFLRQLADRIEAGEGSEVLIGLWNTGFAGPLEFCFQVVTEVHHPEQEYGSPND
jgi:hypothetical protein